jgi:muramoyltetrapeptide carboxypeptidase
MAEQRFEGLGLHCSYSRNAEMRDRFDSSPVEARVSDLHEAFADPAVKGIFTTLGGYNSNQLLGYLDYDLIRANPKIFCGFSDITALATAIHSRTGLATYSGPHFTTFGMKRGIEYTTEYFERCLMHEEPFEVLPPDHWSRRSLVPGPGEPRFRAQPRLRDHPGGRCGGKVARGHLGTLCLLFGTPYMSDLEGTILLIEDDEETGPVHFDRELQSLIHQPGFRG